MTTVADAGPRVAAGDPADFEARRLALFERHGLAGEGRRLNDRDGRSTYAIVAGDSGAHPTVLVHGGLSHAGEWALMAGHLPGPLVIPDRPGCGLSYPIDYRGSDYRRAASDWLLALADGLGAERLDLVGNSMGGYFSLAFARAHPERVRRLALLGAPAGIDWRIPLLLRLWGNPLSGRVMTRFPITDPEKLRSRVFGPLLVARPDEVPLEVLELAVAGFALPGAGWGAHTMLRRVLTFRGWRPELSLREWAVTVSAPTLVAWGDKDAFTPPERGRELAARMADARFEVVPGAGHLPHLDRPGVVAGLITSFLGARRHALTRP